VTDFVGVVTTLAHTNSPLAPIRLHIRLNLHSCMSARRASNQCSRESVTSLKHRKQHVPRPVYPDGFERAVKGFLRLPREPPRAPYDPEVPTLLDSAVIKADTRSLLQWLHRNVQDVRRRDSLTVVQFNHVCLHAWACEFDDDYARLLRWLEWAESIADETDSNLGLQRLYSCLVPFMVLRG
jgi:hypothetical protein